MFLCVFLIFSAVKAEINNLDVEHIVQVITQSQAEAFKYDPPENAYQYRAIDQSVAGYETFDYIVVGAGSAGSVLATRLSENENNTILLLEAGGEESTFSDIPAMMMHLRGTEFTWNYKSVPQTTSCLGMVDRRCPHPLGKGIGGTSIINAGMYVRGNKYDFDSWAKAGNDGWYFEDLLPYFKKSENSQINGDSGYHGKGGLFNVEYHSPISPVTKAFIEANQELGRKIVDYNGKEQLGVSYAQFNTLNGHRLSTAKAFLSTARRRKNLKVLTHSYAKQLLINEDKVAYGVVFDHNERTKFARASKEIILSAGVVGSPQLLMLSGVGPSSVLKPLNIPHIHDLPVGQNYQDHPTVFPLLFTTNYSEPIKTLHENVRDYLNGIGPLTSAANTQALAFLRTKSASTPIGVPNIEVVLIPQNSSNNYFQKAYNLDKETYNLYWPKLDETTTITIFMTLLHSESRGKLTLKSSNPYEYPNIDPNFLSDKQGKDIQMMYEGIGMVLEMLNTSAFKTIDTKLYFTVAPACTNYVYLSEEQWFCQIRHLTMHAFHPVGTCKMAPHPDKGGVVDSQLKVHGIKKLRVGDASVFPEATSGHPVAPVVVIAEKLADMLQNE